MQQDVKSVHVNDASGNPAGGETKGLGILINWQDGPLLVKPADKPAYIKEPNGAFVEGVIAAALDRLNYYQASKFKCRENALAITKLEEALHWCNHRTQNREKRGVEGTHQK